ncbi:hypothetical protein VTJ49DRAFT_5918 [Mycothermus thermophilus]|uniref:Uncharacterized protein n=1 Tax=Humicola insolens TaxID=85995 RepID=A0ABR3VJS3_HUMIN
MAAPPLRRWPTGTSTPPATARWVSGESFFPILLNNNKRQESALRQFHPRPIPHQLTPANHPTTPPDRSNPNKKHTKTEPTTSSPKTTSATSRPSPACRPRRPTTASTASAAPPSCPCSKRSCRATSGPRPRRTRPT